MMKFYLKAFEITFQFSSSTNIYRGTMKLPPNGKKVSKWHLDCGEAPILQIFDSICFTCFDTDTLMVNIMMLQDAVKGK